MRVARGDFARHRYAQAADSYSRALEAAWRLDDPRLLATVGGERALALLRAGQAVSALDAAEMTSAELARRGQTLPPLLVLTAAAAEVELGRFDAASRRLRSLGAGASTDPLVAGRRAYLEGRIAAATGDRVGLRASIAGLPTAGPPTLAADRLELEARSLLLDRRAAPALDALLELKEQREQLDQLAAVGEALALAGEAAAMTGDAAAAGDLYLRAARNAYALDRAELAHTRLELSRAQASVAGDPELVRAIELLAERLPDDTA